MPFRVNSVSAWQGSQALLTTLYLVSLDGPRGGAPVHVPSLSIAESVPSYSGTERLVDGRGRGLLRLAAGPKYEDRSPSSRTRRHGARTQLRRGFGFPTSPPSTVRRGFRRLGHKYSAARDLHREPQITRQYEPRGHGYYREQQGKERSKIPEPKRLQHR